MKDKRDTKTIRYNDGSEYKVNTLYQLEKYIQTTEETLNTKGNTTIDVDVRNLNKEYVYMLITQGINNNMYNTTTEAKTTELSNMYEYYKQTGVDLNKLFYKYQDASFINRIGKYLEGSSVYQAVVLDIKQGYNYTYRVNLVDLEARQTIMLTIEFNELTNQFVVYISLKPQTEGKNKTSHIKLTVGVENKEGNGYTIQPNTVGFANHIEFLHETPKSRVDTIAASLTEVSNINVNTQLEVFRYLKDFEYSDNLASAISSIVVQQYY